MCIYTFKKFFFHKKTPKRDVAFVLVMMCGMVLFFVGDISVGNISVGNMAGNVISILSDAAMRYCLSTRLCLPAAWQQPVFFTASAAGVIKKQKRG